MYVEYLKEFWYIAEVEEETKTITFLLSWWDKPISFTQDEFVSAIGLPICKDVVPLPPKETVTAGLATLGLFDKDKPTLSSIVLVNSSPLKMKKLNICYTTFLSLMFENLLGKDYASNDLTIVKPHTITTASFQKPLASEVSLTSHTLKVAKFSKEPEQSLLPPFGEVNADDTADKSLSKAFVQHVTQSKATTDMKTKKKKIPPSSKPKSPYQVSVILSKKQVAETQHAEVTVATADATKSLEASELVEEQGNPPSTVEAKKLLDEADKLNKVVQEIPESPYDIESEIKVVKSFFNSHIFELKDQTMHDSEEIADFHEGSDSDLQLMPDDDFLPDHKDHICEEVSSLHSKPMLTPQQDALKDTLPHFDLRPPQKFYFGIPLSKEIPVSKTTSSIFSPTPPREPTPPKYQNPPKYESKGKEGPLSQEKVMARLKEMKRLADLKAKKAKSEKLLKKILNPSTIRAQTQKMAKHEAKRQKMLDEYNYQISFRANQLPIIKISYIVNPNKEATMKITRGDNPLNLIVHPNFRLKTLGFSEWLEVHTLTSKKYRKLNDMLLKSLRAKFQSKTSSEEFVDYLKTTRRWMDICEERADYAVPGGLSGKLNIS
ncbi:hypothetical protein Tco_0897272 [Tanacetum coccineum]